MLQKVRIPDTPDAKSEEQLFQEILERLQRGEYMKFQITANSTMVMNLFDLGEEKEYDENARREEAALHLTKNIAILKELLMEMIKFGSKKEPDFEEELAMDSIIEEVLAHLFEIRGIVDGDPASLDVTKSDYTSEKKELPIIYEFYLEILKRCRENTNPHHDKAYSLIVDGMKIYVRELYYVPEAMTDALAEKMEILAKEAENSDCICQTKSENRM